MEQRLGMISVSDKLIEGGSPYIHSTGDQILGRRSEGCKCIVTHCNKYAFQ